MAVRPNVIRLTSCSADDEKAAQHFTGIPNGPDVTVPVVTPTHRNLFDPVAESLGMPQDLTVKPETVLRKQRENAACGRPREALEPALGVA